MDGRAELPDGWPDDPSKPRLKHEQALEIVQEEMASRGVPYPDVLAARFAEVTRRPLLYPFTPAGRRLFTLRHGLPPSLRNPPEPPPYPVED
jgi:hypothetical protein